MLHYLKEYKKFTEITGYKNIVFSKAEKFLKDNRKGPWQDVDIQFFDAELIATQEHLYFAVMDAAQAFQNETNISKSLAMETMLFASAQRQIKKALHLCGIKPETKNMAAVIISKDQDQVQKMFQKITKCIGVNPDEIVLDISKNKINKIKEAFQISNEEIKTVMKNDQTQKAVISLVVERAALLSTQL